MIVCSCNVLSDQDVRSAVEAERRRSTSRVYGCLGCSAQCGRCAGTIRRLMDETLGNARASSCNGCARSAAPPSSVINSRRLSWVNRIRCPEQKSAQHNELASIKSGAPCSADSDLAQVGFGSRLCENPIDAMIPLLNRGE